MIDISMENAKKIALILCIALIYPLLIKKGFELIKGKKAHDKYYLYTTAIAGTCAVIVGTILKINFIGAGLILGGAFSVYSGAMSSWNVVPDLLYFILLLIFFAVALLGSYRLLVQAKK